MSARPPLTPAKNPFTLPTKTLEAAIEGEWDGQKKFVSAKMPLTALAYTAIDRIAPLGTVDRDHSHRTVSLDQDVGLQRV